VQSPNDTSLGRELVKELLGDDSEECAVYLLY
jgi:hypothetical protein